LAGKERTTGINKHVYGGSAYRRYWRHRREFGGGVARARFRCVAEGPAPMETGNRRKYIRRGLASAHREGTGEDCARERLTFYPDLKEAVSRADVSSGKWLRNGGFKIKLFAR